MPARIAADGVGRFPGHVEAAAYFSIVEALQNAAKHASASQVLVRVWCSGGNLCFEVEDDGCGFPPDRARQGSGLVGITDRLAAVGGRLEVRTEPGTGTTIAGRIPIDSMPLPA
jgi:signal transduction histidine kinase